MRVIEKIKSVCTICFQEGLIQKIDGSIIEEDGKVWITKECNKHGFFKDLYFGDIALYKRWMNFKVTGTSVSDIKTSIFNHSELYFEHKSQTVLTNLVVTNRCNDKFSNSCINSETDGCVYEPTLDQLKELMKQARDQKPIGSKSIQITGGEPTLREDILDIVRCAKEVGFSNVQIQTNGLKLAESIKLCTRLKEENVNTIYLVFNGITKKTNPLIEQNKKAMENLRKINLEVALVPFLNANNINEVGKIVRFAIDNMDIIKGVNFQIDSFCEKSMKIKPELRKSQQLDYINAIEEIEKEFKDQISRDDFYPISFVFPISKIIEIIRKETQVELSAHPGCGGSTFLFIEDGRPIPITRFIDVEAFLEYLIKQSKKKGPIQRLRVAASFFKNIERLVNYENVPQGFDLKQIFKDAALGGKNYALRNLGHKSLFVGFMCFQNIYNLNIDRLQRCVIHYTTLEGIIPSCSYCVLGYGNKIRKKHSISITEWEKNTGQKIKNDR